MASQPFRRRTVPLEPAGAEMLRPFGALLGRAGGRASPSRFYEGQVRMARPIEFACAHPVELQLATLGRRAGEVRYLERHFQHTQTFIPLGGEPFVMVLAPPSAGETPDIEAARAFLFDGSAGFALHLGVWHEFPFAVADDIDMVVVLSAQTGYDLAAKDPLTREARGPDLDKKDIAARTGVILTVELPAQAA